MLRPLTLLAACAAAMFLAAPAGAGGQATLSWTLDDDRGRPSVSWEITGSTNWYVGVIQIASRPDVTSKGAFLAQNVVAYDVLAPDQSKGTWKSGFALSPGTYYGQLVLRYDGPCRKGCESRSSVRSFAVEPPALAVLDWHAAPKAGKVTVVWTKPGGGWYVSMVLVDDDRDFSSPEDAVVWPAERSSGRWTSAALDAGTYYVRVSARYSGCDTCLWASDPATVRVRSTNLPPRFRAAGIEIVQRVASLHHTWQATFTVCDSSAGRLAVEVREETWAGSGGPAKSKVSVLHLAAPGGCRTYTVTRPSTWRFAPGRFVRIALRARDAEGAWSRGERSQQWYTP